MLAGGIRASLAALDAAFAELPAAGRDVPGDPVGAAIRNAAQLVHAALSLLARGTELRALGVHPDAPPPPGTPVSTEEWDVALPPHENDARRAADAIRAWGGRATLDASRIDAPPAKSPPDAAPAGPPAPDTDLGTKALDPSRPDEPVLQGSAGAMERDPDLPVAETDEAPDARRQRALLDLAPPAEVRDVARALGVALGWSDRLAQTVLDGLWHQPQEALAGRSLQQQWVTADDERHGWTVTLAEQMRGVALDEST